MDEMVERVARAILAAAGQANSPSIQNDLDHPATASMYAKRYARAAITAMREPTVAMRQAGDVAQMATDGIDAGFQIAMDSGVPWRAMIDAALRD
jgi:hypothetical protein